VSHWTSGLPKLDLEPFDPTPLWDAAEESTAERPLPAPRRRWTTAVLAVGGLAAVLAVLGVLALVR
jgi:ferric-dicitrate binding protein FerR (iron transport regulator)